jgi:hypothetical protein
MNEASPTAAPRSAVRILGIKNLAFCAAWCLTAAFLFLTRLWFSINELFQVPSQIVSGMVSGRATALVPLLGAVGQVFAMGILIGWVFSLPSALIMSTTGYYPRFLRWFTPFKPGDESVKKNHTDTQAAKAQGQVSRQIFEQLACPHCGAAWRIDDYSQDSDVWFCSGCRNPLPRNLSKMESSAYQTAEPDGERSSGLAGSLVGNKNLVTCLALSRCIRGSLSL